ncbi:hypothetical protein MIMGU_mgv1a006787mg [Erythranthe guttata]|uniref:Uncharacterized protein n=1 Tax=Erythranthe guttata TaxID=4155 RepID=A0A022R9J8_ERYGU|nr:hypothetical protein MIMGU_mgv1a006787mg [Erythranthe guttata]
MELSRSRDVVLEAKEDPDATENSSSFADTISGNENTSGLSDAEVESQFFGGSGVAPPFDGFGSIFPIRKRKMTAHWRSYVQPIMWRCKWTELKIKELESRALKYAREISLYDSMKHTVSNQITEEQKSSKMMSFTHHQSRRRSLMRRIKRKRVEDTTDLASYMSNHVLFSERDQTTTGQDEFGIYDENLFPEDDDDDNFLEDTLRKIDLVHARVHKLKSQLDVVMINNAGKFSSSENLSQLLGCDFQTSSARSPTYSACNGDTVSVGGIYQINNISDYELGDFVMNDSAVSSFGEAIPIPDIIESTVGLLSSIDVTQHQPQIGDSSEKIVDNILIQNEAASEVEGSIFKYSHNQSAEKILEAENSGGEEESNTNNAVEPADVAAKGFATTDQSVLKSCLSSEIHFPKNKRKRGERKAGSANWSRQRPGEPDS